MLGNSQETEVFWKQLNRQSQADFKVSVNKEELNHVYLLQALQYHCCIKLKNIQQFSSHENTSDYILDKSGIVNGSNSFSNSK